jgi:uncharacterized membrane protein YhaH (DUF805 family)
VNGGSRDGGLLDVVRLVALIVVAAGAAGSIYLMIHASQHPPPFLLALFVIWVVSPFVLLAWANLVSKRWSGATRVALYVVTFVITLASLAIYGNLVMPPAGSPRAFVFVAVPPASCLLMAIVLIAALVSRRRRPLE